LAGLERGVRKEGGQFAQAGLDILRRHGETAGHVDQLVQVFHARLAVAAAVLFVVVTQAGVGDGVVDLFGQRQALAILSPLPSGERVG
jgi:hypothetical protein